MLHKWRRSPEFQEQSQVMKDKRLSTVKNENGEFVSSLYFEPTSKKTKSIVSLVRAVEDSNNIYYFDEECPTKEVVRSSFPFYSQNLWLWLKALKYRLLFARFE